LKRTLPVRELTGRHLAPTQAESDGGGHGHGADEQAEGQVDDLVGEAHLTQGDGAGQYQDCHPSACRQDGRPRAARGTYCFGGQIGQEQSQTQDDHAKQHLAAEGEETSGQAGNGRESQQARSLDGGE